MTGDPRVTKQGSLRLLPCHSARVGDIVEVDDGHTAQITGTEFIDKTKISINYKVITGPLRGAAFRKTAPVQMKLVLAG